jgi:hypothetical protein
MLLLDTGAPSSFGQGLTGVPGVPADPPDTMAEGLTIDWLTGHIHHPFDGLIGAEVLCSNTLTIDPVERTLELSQTQVSEGEGVPIRDMMNVPVFDGVIAGHTLPVIFDTGAPLGFASQELVRGQAPIGRMAEFYPMFGPFVTNVYKLPLEIGDKRKVLRFGTFPDKIEQLHAQARAPVLIGLELLDHYRISVGLREQRLLLEPVA